MRPVRSVRSVRSVRYAICTDGTYSCLWFQLIGRGHDLLSFRMAQIQNMSQGQFRWQTPATLKLVAEFLECQAD